MATKKTTLALASSALLLAAGCGDGAPSKEEFAKQADEICRDVERRLGKIREGGGRSTEQIANQIDEVEQAGRDAVRRLRRLEKPEGDAGETAEQFVDTLDSQLNDQVAPALRDLEEAVREGDQRALRKAGERLQQVDERRSDRLARELGADDCVD